MKNFTRFFLAGSAVFLSMPGSQQAFATTTLNCTNMTVTQIKRALDNQWMTSLTCVNQILQKINTVSPLNPPHIVSDYAGLQTFPGLNAYVYLNERLRAQAIQADKLRRLGIKKPLLGVPIAIKDTIPIAGFSNSSGNYNLRGLYNPTVNDPGVQRLLDSGAIIIGQNNQHEFGSGLTSINFSYGPVRNAHDQTRIAGGSTGGGATAVASKIAPLAVGDDLAGSLRVPSALNGVIGYRPSIARYASPTGETLVIPYSPYASNISEKDKMDVRGMVARSVKDLVLVDKFLSVDGGVTPNLRKSIRGIRLGVPENFYQNMEPDVEKVVKKALKKLKNRGAILVTTPSIPNIDPAQPIPGPLGPMATFKDVWSTKTSIVLSGNRYWSQEAGIPLSPVGPDTAAGLALINYIVPAIFPTKADEETYYNGVLIPATEQSNTGYEQYFADNNLDAVIYPTNLLKAAQIETIVVNGGDPLTNGLYDFSYTTALGRTGPVSSFYQENCQLSPHLGTPSLTMPIGLTAPEHMPVGMQIEGLRGQDAKVLEIGAAFQRIFGVFLAS